MDLHIIYSKTAKGSRAVMPWLGGLSSQMKRVLSKVDGKLSTDDILLQSEKLTKKELQQILLKLENEGYIQRLTNQAAEPDWLNSVSTYSMGAINNYHIEVEEVDADALNFAHSRFKPKPAAKIKEATKQKEHQEAEVRAKAETEGKAKEEMAAKEKREAKRKAQAGAAEKARLGAIEQAKRIAEAEAKARQEIERIEREKAEADAKAKVKAVEEAKAEAERKAEEELVKKAKQEAEEQARLEAERIAEAAEKARLEAEEQARHVVEAEAKVRQEAERLEREKMEADAKAKARAEEKARLKAEAESKAQVKAAEKARLEADVQVKQTVERITRAVAQAKAQAVEEAKVEAERKAEEELATKAKQEAEEQARLKAERIAEAEAAEQAKRVAEAAEKVRLEAEAADKAKAEDDARLIAEAKAKTAEEAQLKAAAAEQARFETERIAREEAEKQARVESERKVREDVEKRAQRAAEKTAREEAKGLARQEKEAKAKLKVEGKARTKKMRRPIMLSKWVSKSIKALLILTPLTAVLIVGLLHVVNLSMLIKPIEKLASDSIGEPVTVKEVHVSLFPQQRLILTDVTVGSGVDIKVGTVYMLPDVSTLFEEVKVLKLLEVGSLTLNPADLGRQVQWVNATAKADKLKIERIALKQVSFTVPGLELAPFDGKVARTPSGEFSNVELFSVDRNLTLLLTPQNGSCAFTLTASIWQPPLVKQLELDEVTATGVISQSRASFTQIEAKAYGGTIKAQATVDWTERLSASGSFELTKITLQRALSAFGNSASAVGTLNASATFASSADQVSELVEAAEVNANFEALGGKINGVALTYALLNSSGSPPSDADFTRFDTLTGNLQFKDGQYKYKQLALKTSQFYARGNLDIGPDQIVSGKVRAELTSKLFRRQATFNISGEVADVKLQ